MRIVTSNTNIWRRGGIAATDIAGLVGCAVEERDHCLSLWANKVYMREKADMKRMAGFAQGTADWHAWRNKGVGGSEVAAVVGAYYGNKKDGHDLWREKTSPVKAEAENANMKRGKAKEPVARDLYERIFEWKVPDCCVLHDTYDFIRCSLDGLRSDDELIVEIKCCGDNNHRKLLKIQEVHDPLQRQIMFSELFNYYRYQVLYQLLITGAKVCHFLGFNEAFEGSRKLAIIELYPEPNEQEHLLERVVQFWDFVERRDPPPMEWCLPCWNSPTDIQIVA